MRSNPRRKKSVYNRSKYAHHVQDPGRDAVFSVNHSLELS